MVETQKIISVSFLDLQLYNFYQIKGLLFADYFTALDPKSSLSHNKVEKFLSSISCI